MEKRKGEIEIHCYLHRSFHSRIVQVPPDNPITSTVQSQYHSEMVEIRKEFCDFSLRVGEN